MSRSRRLMVVLLCLAMVSALPVGAADSTIFPTPGAKDVCPDSPLKITFSSPPVVGAGKIQVFDASNDSVVATIDVTQRVQTKIIGSLPNYNYYPIFITENVAAIVLPEMLAYGKTYYVKIAAGTFKDFAGISDDSTWQFTTKSAPPAQGAAKLIVAADGSGDFASVQGAIDSLPEQNATPVTILIKNGTYNEIICIFEKHGIT